MTEMTEECDAGAPAPIVWMFSGQGSQYFGMGRSLYEGNRTFRAWMDRLDGVAAEYAGQSIVEVLYGEGQSKGRPFDYILHTHPALFMVQYAMSQTLLAEDFPAPDHLFGSSLGEFVAAAVAGVTAVDDMLFDVIKQARLFEAHCSGGAMLVVIDDIETFRTNPAFSGCELAGINFDRCFVVSGTKGRILEVAEALREQDVTHQLLPVSMAFHSSLVDNVGETFRKAFAGRACRPPEIPVVSCALSPGGGERGEVAAYSSAYWWRVIRQPIEFKQALAEFERMHPRAIYLDLGPSGSMATFTKYNLPAGRHDRIMPIMTPFGRDGESLGAVRQALSAILASGAAR